MKWLAKLFAPKQPTPQEVFDRISRAVAYRCAFTDDMPAMTPLERALYDDAKARMEPPRG